VKNIRFQLCFESRGLFATAKLLVYINVVGFLLLNTQIWSVIFRSCIFRRPIGPRSYWC